MKTHANSLPHKMLARVRSRGPGSVFTATDFLPLGSRAAVDQALSRACRAGLMQKVARGVYEIPVRDKILGLLSASSDSVAKAVAARDSARIQIAGGAAANSLGLTDQVPLRTVYLTDGGARRLKVGKATILFKRTTPRQMATAGRFSGTLIQALRHIGRTNVDDAMIAKLRKVLSTKDRNLLLRDLRYAPGWVADIMRSVALGKD